MCTNPSQPSFINLTIVAVHQPQLRISYRLLSNRYSQAMSSPQEIADQLAIQQEQDASVQRFRNKGTPQQRSDTWRDLKLKDSNGKVEYDMNGRAVMRNHRYQAVGGKCRPDPSQRLDMLWVRSDELYEYQPQDGPTGSGPWVLKQVMFIEDGLQSHGQRGSVGFWGSWLGEFQWWICL
ncbi:uncharacterized protein PAC_15931 [Phialocephala subalpina]|uniref:Uncharacterized protein n=1 Tax=Phialocephala subalpina TaxID=576137 RepID=A0A1L7XLU3_9HELO|nr:uncharacterized protein PAC_15931 [Phialocephala subalpina]